MTDHPLPPSGYSPNFVEGEKQTLSLSAKLGEYGEAGRGC
jgi:hypothetical protein